MARAAEDEEFRLEDEDGDLPSGQKPTARPSLPSSESSPASPPRARRDDGPEVSAVPFRERLDPGSVTKPGRLAPPPGWPGEALFYPLRGRGFLSLAIGAAVIASADVLTRSNAFLGAIVKVLLLVWVLRWQMRTIVATASGDDRPPRAYDGSAFEGENLGALLGVLVRLLLYAVPAGVAFVRPYLIDPKDGAHDARSLALVIGLAALAALFAPVMMLGAATGNRRMLWPWGAIPWLFRGFFTCVAVAVGWASLVAVEILVTRLPEASLVDIALRCFALRVASVHLLLVGARALGVLGRRFEL